MHSTNRTIEESISTVQWKCFLVKSETKLTASSLKNDLNIQKVQKNFFFNWVIQKNKTKKLANFHRFTFYKLQTDKQAINLQENNEDNKNT